MNLVSLCTLIATAAATPCKILSLSGGGAYGAFEIGVVSNIIDSGNGGWNYISGVSAGSLNAYYLSTIPAEQEKAASKTFKKMWTELGNSDVYSLSMFTNGLSLFSTIPLERTLTRILKDRKIVRPIQVSATSLPLGRQVVFNETCLKENNHIPVLMASSAIPLLFPPIKVGEDYYVDGGLSGNVLIDEPLARCGSFAPVEIDVVVCGVANIEVNDFHDKPGLEKLVSRLLQLVGRQVEYYELNDMVLENPNLRINLYEMRDNRPGYEIINFNNAASLFDEGYHNYKLTVFGGAETSFP